MEKTRVDATYVSSEADSSVAEETYVKHSDTNVEQRQRERRRGVMGRRFIGVLGLQQLRRYKYQGQDFSLTSKYILQPFWSSVVTLIPSWVAPNAITLAGFVCIVVSYFLSWALAPGLVEPLPSFALVLYGLLLFTYQTLDAIDGKQARRTNSSGPLGELFDHGCDALVATMEVLPFCSSLRLGPHKAVLAWFCGTATFFMATWENYHTHILRLPILNGPTEGLALFYLIFFSLSITGSEVWYTPIQTPQSLRSHLHLSDPTIPLVDILLYLFVLLGVIPTIISNVLCVREATGQNQEQQISSDRRKPQSGLRGPDSAPSGSIESDSTTARQAGTPGQLQLALPYWALLCCVCIWAFGQPNSLEARNPHLFFLVPTFSVGLMSGHLILAHVTGESDRLLRSMWQALLLQPLVLLNVALARASMPHLPEEVLFVALLLHTGYLYTQFVFGVTQEICAELQIYCLRLGKRKIS